MPALRKTIQNEISNLLDDTVFTADDFTLTFGEDGVFTAFFCYDKRFRFDCYYNSYDNNWHVEMSPGVTHEHESLSCQDLARVKIFLSHWASAIREELKAQQPVYAELDQLKEMIETQIKSSLDDGNEEFAVEEINNLKEKFEMLSKRVDELENSNSITKKQNKTIQDGISQVKEDIGSIPKKTWYKVATNKLAKTISTIAKTKEGRAILASGTKKLLGIE